MTSVVAAERDRGRGNEGAPSKDGDAAEKRRRAAQRAAGKVQRAEDLRQRRQSEGDAGPDITGVKPFIRVRAIWANGCCGAWGHFLSRFWGHVTWAGSRQPSESMPWGYGCRENKNHVLAVARPLYEMDSEIQFGKERQLL